MATKYNVDANYDYTTGAKITIENTVDACKAKTCVAAAPAVRTLMSYDEVIKHPCMKWEYLFDGNGAFALTEKANVTKDGTVAADKIVYTKEDGKTYVNVVTAYVKSKNTDIRVPAYRTANAKTLKIDETMTFTTKYKDEVVFYEKVGEAYGAELLVTIAANA